VLVLPGQQAELPEDRVDVRLDGLGLTTSFSQIPRFDRPWAISLLLTVGKIMISLASNQIYSEVE
jgi:hypothetical protein